MKESIKALLLALLLTGCAHHAPKQWVDPYPPIDPAQLEQLDKINHGYGGIKVGKDFTPMSHDVDDFLPKK